MGNRSLRLVVQWIADFIVPVGLLILAAMVRNPASVHSLAIVLGYEGAHRSNYPSNKFNRLNIWYDQRPSFQRYLIMVGVMMVVLAAPISLDSAIFLTVALLLYREFGKFYVGSGR